MAKTERELAFLRDFEITENWTRRFTDLLDKHIGFKDAKKILYINAGTGDHCIAIREKLDDKTSLFAACENEELLHIAKDKGEAVKAKIDFGHSNLEDGSFDAVIADASFTPPGLVEGLVESAVRGARKGGEVAVVLPSSGSFGEIFSLLWEVFFSEDLGEHGHVVETMISDLPSVSSVEEMAGRNGLEDVTTESANEVFEYQNGAEFIAAPLVADFFFPVWLKTLKEEEKERVSQKLAQLIDDEDGSLSFRFSVKATLVRGKKA